jgi:hypothetical protein
MTPLRLRLWLTRWWHAGAGALMEPTALLLLAGLLALAPRG